MLKIRLQRTGRRNDPSYRVVVTEHTRGPKSQKHVDRVGFYNPKTKEKKLDEEKIKHWMSVGAKASGTMHNMLIKAGIIKGETINVLPQKTPVVKEVEETEEKVANQEAPVDTSEKVDSQDDVAEDSTDEQVEGDSVENADVSEDKKDETETKEVEGAQAEEVAENADKAKDGNTSSSEASNEEISKEEVKGE